MGTAYTTKAHGGGGAAVILGHILMGGYGCINLMGFSCALDSPGFQTAQY